MIIFTQSTDFDSEAFGAMCFTFALILQTDIGYHGHNKCILLPIAYKVNEANKPILNIHLEVEQKKLFDMPHENTFSHKIRL